jgi:site-specific DNA-methyltransferase (adenine-specific)
MEKYLNKIHCANCITFMKELPDNSVDAIITDPPYGLGFMGKQWDTFDKYQFGIKGNEGKNDLKVKKNFNILPRYNNSKGLYYFTLLWAKECLRILKSGGHLLSFGGTRTYHRMACAIEDVGFEIRDQIQWLYGSGFPKSLNISKAIDKKFGVEREITQEEIEQYKQNGNTNFDMRSSSSRERRDLPVAEKAIKWDGWGTALKPAHEPICMARKPISEKTVADNVLKWGTGGINIDASRIKFESGGTIATNPKLRVEKGCKTETGDRIFCQGKLGKKNTLAENVRTGGRFPSNVILDEETAKMLDKQSGISKSCGGRIGKKSISNIDFGLSGEYKKGDPGFGDIGGASRFFYCPKASKAERNKGLKELERIKTNDGRKKEIDNAFQRGSTLRHNNHPTVKPIKLMQYLIKLITPPNGVVLDCFAGSGSTLVACRNLGFDFIGIEKEQEYCDIANARIKAEQAQLKLPL